MIALTTKYRPKTIAELRGQPRAVNDLKALVNHGTTGIGIDVSCANVTIKQWHQYRNYRIELRRFALNAATPSRSSSPKQSRNFALHDANGRHKPNDMRRRGQNSFAHGQNAERNFPCLIIEDAKQSSAHSCASNLARPKVVKRLELPSPAEAQHQAADYFAPPTRNITGDTFTGRSPKQNSEGHYDLARLSTTSTATGETTNLRILR